MHVTAIIAAAGRGLRFGASQPKQLLEIAGRPMLLRSIDAFLAHPAVHAVIVALPPETARQPPAYMSSSTTKPLTIVAGGDRRQDSVANAVRAAGATDLLVIHDAARPFASADLISRTIDAAGESGAALAALQARDTVKRAAVDDRRVASNPALRDSAGGGAPRTVAETLPREAIFLAQTPQAFRRDVLASALAIAGDATDEATLVERAGHPVRIVEGEATNIKITTADDLVVAEAIARTLRNAEFGMRNADGGPFDHEPSALSPQPSGSRPARTGRAGTGYDLHRLVEGRPLVIGGVVVPSDRGALGHSDADVVCHAVTDAILGAAGLGDIGGHFPDSDARWKDASSLDLLRRAVALVREEQLEVGNVDVTVILERPKIRDYVAAMRTAVAAAAGIDVARVSIKGKTNEGLDALGRGEAIAAHAIALIRAI
jgi:2-C-methyl-D-erythritol 4-phosphate cytidylyltransferase/2-C-methyl-D-erythritol 2,4-cyclodiphosphate synthase